MTYKAFTLLKILWIYYLLFITPGMQMWRIPLLGNWWVANSLLLKNISSVGNFLAAIQKY